MTNKKNEKTSSVNMESHENVVKKDNSMIVVIVMIIVLVAISLLGKHIGMFEGFGSIITGSLENVLEIMIKIIIAIILVILLHKLFVFGFKVIQKQKGRMATLASLISSLEKYAVILLGFCWVLYIIGVNVSTIFAGIGIVALIVGFGAESLVADLVTGIFILFENEYNVGDIIETDGFRGIVKEIGIRTVSIEDVGGNIKIINNSQLKNVINRSNQISVVVCEMKVAYKTNLKKLDKLLAEALPVIKERYTDVFTNEIQFTGIEKVEDNGITLRFIAEVEEEDFFNGRRILNRELKELFDKEKMSVPYFSESENK